MSDQRILRIAAGAGYSGDRIEPAVDLARRGALDYLVFECLAERTIADAQMRRRLDPAGGYDPFLDDRLRAVLGPCRQAGTRIISNMGAANPAAAARRVFAIARELDLPAPAVAAVSGDDVFDICRRLDVMLDNGLTISQLGDRVISANAYLGAKPIADALAAEADIVLTGRASDPALFLAPLIHEFGWRMDDWDILGKGTLIGHLLECAGQVCGGYFADPGYKDVPDMAHLGFPLAEVDAHGSALLTKLDGTGGRISAATVKEQLLYEIHDPARYLQPDVVANFSEVSISDDGGDRVRVAGATGTAKTGLLKVSISYQEGFVGEGQISYAGPGAVERGRLAMAILRTRLSEMRTIREVGFSLIGMDALHGPVLAHDRAPYEVRVRAVGRAASARDAARIGQEVEALYTNGPAGGGGAVKSVRAGIGLASALIDEGLVDPQFEMLREDIA